MKKNILRISILPLILFTVLAFTGLQQQKDKNNKGNNPQTEGTSNGKSQGQKNNDAAQGNKNNNGPQGNNNNSQQNNNPQQHGNKGKNMPDEQPGNKGKDNDNENGDHKSDQVRGNEDHGNGKMKNEGHRKEVIKWAKDDNINWNVNNFPNRKSPKDQKKVTICHHTGSTPVTISISENALQAHLNHGDQIGNCTVNYNDRWPKNYIKARENVYNVYEQTWETMSYSEALLNYAVQRLLGVKTNLDRSRPTLTAQEVQRREALILDLQNNVNSLENQLDVTRQRLDNVNIIIQL